MASAQVATISQQQPHLPGPSSRTSSPHMASKTSVKHEDPSAKPSPSQNKASLSESQSTSQAEDSKPTVQTTEPLAPPPRPAPVAATETPDYFSSLHNPSTGISQEFNPFEQSFGVPSAETPGKNLLPSVAALTSPAIPGASSTGVYNWQGGSLRSGPLSPAMLTGPQQGDYFDSIGRGFPTPNESSLRTGLTPGGGGSMFPAPSPNSQAIFNQLQSGGATPGTLDFHRTAMTAAARNKNNQFAQTSNLQDQMAPNNTMDAQHDATDAANGLFMLAKGGQANNQFAVPNQPSGQTRNGDQKRSARNNGSTDMSANGDSPESHEEASRPNTRGGRGKKSTKADSTPNNRRKSEASQKSGSKRAKGNSGAAMVDPALDPHDDDDDSEIEEETHDQNGRKMTDEEKRRNFLERNRVAALKCRQRKKQWLANLQAKVEMYSAENETLNQQVGQLHDEIRNLRTLLMGHKDCPVGHAQGIGQFLNGMQDPSGFPSQHVNPYGMAMPNGGMQQGMQRS